MPKRDQNGERKRLRDEELHSLYCSSNVASVIKFTRLKWAGLVARMKKVKSSFKILTSRAIEKRPQALTGGKY